MGLRPPRKRRSLFVKRTTVLTNVYIDGFNLFYGALKGSTLKWLDVRRLAETLFPDDQINHVYYFTARLRTTDGSSGGRQRQDVYLRALGTVPALSLVYGTFRRRGESWEEKKTDVNLATTLIFDAFLGEFEQAVVITNDSDLVNPIQRLRDELGMRITVVNPRRRQKTHHELRDAATEVIRIKEEHLKVSQLPPRVQDVSGRWISKPPHWD